MKITSVVSTTNNYTFEPSSEFVGEQNLIIKEDHI